MKCTTKIVLAVTILALICGFVAPRFVSENMDVNLKFGPPTERDAARIREEALLALKNPLERFLLWPGKLVISKQYSFSTYEVNAYTFFGIRFATLQVKCFGPCSSFRKEGPGELEITYTGDEVKLDKSSYDATGWKTYQSKEHYIFKYKPGWIVRTSPQGSMPVTVLEELSIIPKQMQDMYGPSNLIDITVISGLNFDEFIRDIKIGERIDDPLTPLVLNGKKGYIQAGTYYIYHKDNMYQISFGPNEAFGLTQDEEMAALTSIEFID